ncbi:MAG TPA: hypothetical protein VHD60_03225, partial [Candidatus Saccharimonadales bacterium]|nr:hypothetical protein [Candidatus Saccharimonadales bacterium]
LALVSKRDGGSNAKVFLIDTSSNNKLTTIDDSAASFSPIGWQDHYFMYTVSRSSVPSWQSGAVSIESYNADTGKSVTLVNSQATGTSNSDAEYQSIWNTVIVGGKLAYATTWYQYPGYLTVSGKQDQLVMIAPDGTGQKVISSVDAATSYFGTLAKNQPQEAIVQVSSVSGSTSTFYKLEADGTYTQTTDSKLTSSLSYPTYLTSPGGKQTFWTEERDGKNVLFVGDANAQSPKTVATLSTDYTAYGWYTNNYLLVSYKGSELYILPASGLKDGQQPLKVTDYYKPDYGLNGYGYGGGL